MAVKKGFSNVSIQACVYMLVDPRRMEPFYIGIGKTSRPKAHFREADGNSRSLKANKIRKLRRDGFADGEMLVYVAHDLPANVARVTEEWLVASWGRRSSGDGPLTNCTQGGESNPMDEPTLRAKNAEHLRGIHNDPEKNAKRVAAMCDAYKRPDVLANHAAATTHCLEWRQKNVNAVRATSSRPEVRAKNLKQLAIIISDPEILARRNASIVAAHKRPEVKEKNLAQLRATRDDPLWKEKLASRLRALASQPEVRERNIAKLMAIHSDPAMRDKRVTALRAAFAIRRAAKQPV